jgi:hypothetical protein
LIRKEDWEGDAIELETFQLAVVSGLVSTDMIVTIVCESILWICFHILGGGGVGWLARAGRFAVTSDALKVG